MTKPNKFSFLSNQNLKNDLKSRYSYKTNEEFSLLVFENSSIESFLNRFFQLYGLLIHSYTIRRSVNQIEILISYYVTLKTVSILKRQFNKPKKEKFKNYLLKKRDKFKNHLLNITSLIDLNNDFADKLLESFYIFNKQSDNLNVKLTFQNLNKGLSIRSITKPQYKLFKSIKFQMRKYQNRKGFQVRDFTQILLILISKKNSSSILAHFIALQMKYLKRHTPFFSFIKHLSFLLINSNMSNIKGIKIIIKGKINEKLRAKKSILNIGEVPIKTLKANISHSQAVSYSQNGTFGVKVWICENVN